MYEFKDSGKREEFPTGARRDTQENKGRLDLIPWEVLRRLAIVLERGAAKYGDRNWENGIPVSRSFSSLIRHLYQWADGMRDEDHLGHALANLAFIIQTLKWVEERVLPPEMADLPVRRSPRPRLSKDRPGPGLPPILANRLAELEKARLEQAARSATQELFESHIDCKPEVKCP